MVKRFIRKESKGPEVPHGIPMTEEQIRALGSANMKPIGKANKPTKQEIDMNPRSKLSAKNCRKALIIMTKTTLTLLS